jgi:3-oxoisoapionate decarboxylase
MMELGLSSYAYHWACQGDGSLTAPGPMTAVDLVHRTADLGLSVVQLCENVVTFDRSDPEQVHDLRATADATGVRLELGCRLELQERTSLADALRAGLAQAQAIGSRNLRVVPWVGDGGPAVAVREALAAAISAVVPDCARHGVHLAVENHLELSDVTLAELMGDLASEWVGVTLDTVNSVGRLRDPLDTTRLLAPHARGVHLKDYQVLRSAAGYRITGAPLGDGLLDVGEVLRAIDEGGRQPPLLLELWVDPEPDHAATLRKEEDWVRRSVAFARRQLEAVRNDTQT